MPTYDYGCTNCGHVIEVVHGVNEAGPTVCPECGGLLRKRMSAPAIHFRGTGWAKKDARQAIAARAGKGKSEPSDSTGKGAAGSGDKEATPGAVSSSGEGRGKGEESTHGERSTKGDGSSRDEGSKSDRARTASRSAESPSAGGD